MKRPPWLYEALPWMYACAGLAVMLLLRNAMALLSGGLLLLTGGLVWALRRRYRSETRQHVVLGALNLPSPLRWKPQLDTGHELIDRQHRQLFAQCNELIQAVSRRKPDEVLQALLQELLSLLRSHADAEARVAAECGRPLDLEHQRQHDAALRRAEQLRSRWTAGQIDADELVRQVVVELVGEHVAAEVAQLAPSARQPRRQVETA